MVDILGYVSYIYKRGTTCHYGGANLVKQCFVGIVNLVPTNYIIK